MTFKTDMVEEYGIEKWRELQTSYHSQEMPPSDEDAQVAFRVLEMFDFRCFDYGDNQGIDEERVKEILIKNRDEVKNMEMNPTSYIGARVGVFNFLIDDSLHETVKEE